jgi:hypothetical protein
MVDNIDATLVFDIIAVVALAFALGSICGLSSPPAPRESGDGWVASSSRNGNL